VAVFVSLLTLVIVVVSWLCFLNQITFVGGGGGAEDEDDSFQMSRDVWIALGKGSHQYFKRSPPLHFM